MTTASVIAAQPKGKGCAQLGSAATEIAAPEV